jgi:hypothetical protein
LSWNWQNGWNLTVLKILFAGCSKGSQRQGARSSMS